MSGAPRPLGWRDTLAPTLSLFTSTGTLLCCALPALLVTLGAGAALAGLVSTAPWLVALSRYKLWLFAGLALLLLVAWALGRRAARLPCPVEPRAAAAYMRLRRFSAGVLLLSAVTWAIGAFFAFLAGPLFYPG
jgi:uncharacterized membrane protein YbhN (UPF0104 family)